MSHDLIITNQDGEKHSYLVAVGEQNPVIHTKNAPNVPSYGSNPTSPAQAGGLYDVRDTEGDKAITHLDWTLGAGQKSLDTGDANASRFWESLRMDISRPGELRLLNSSTDTHLENFSGPVYSALGYFWAGTGSGGLSYTADFGANWTTCSGHTTGGYPISGMACDGTKVYLACPAGTFTVYANTAAAIGTFAKFGTVGTTTAVRHLAYSSGVLWGATVSGAGTFDSTTGVYTVRSSDFLNKTMSSVALVSAGNAVYWVVAQGERSYVYRLSSAVTSTGVVYTTEQYAEFPTGFVATCARGYLSTVYVGGYYASATAGVGKGVVYECSDQVLAPLFEIGEYPEQTLVPEAPENDNRIYALCNASKDLYILTSRAVYRWDLDGTGYSHVCDFPGVGSSELITSWNAGSLYSWDGTDLSNPAPSYQFPTGWTRTYNVAGSWDYTGGVALLTSTGYSTYTIVGEPHLLGETLSNASGTTLQIVVDGTKSHGGSAFNSQEFLEIVIADGTRAARFTVQGECYNGGPLGFGSDNATKLSLYAWNGSAWTLVSRTYSPMSSANIITLTLQGTLATAKIDNQTTVYTYSTKADATADSITLLWKASGLGYSSQNCGAVDSWTLNSTPAAASSVITDAVFRPSIAFCKGNLMAPYAVSANNVVRTITALSKASPTQVTTSAPHLIAAGGTQVVNISGTNSVPVADGNYVATYVDATNFTVPFNVATTAGTAGTLTFNHNLGYTKTSSDVATVGSLTQSVTSFHSGTVLKDFRYIDVSHDPLPAGATISMNWEIDGVSGNAIGVTSGNHTVFTVDAQGYSIKTTLGLTPDATGTVSPVVRAVNVVWDFVKTKKHQYLLDCRTGAGGGRWDEDSEEAIAFLFATSDKWASFEDRFAGVYTGSIEEVQFSQANYSKSEGYGGLVRVTVREA